MKITINGTPPSINKYIGRTNIWQYQKDKKQIHELVRLSTLKDKPKIPIAKCIMEVSFYFKDKRKRDLSNHIKFIEDGLVKAGIIEDDNYFVVQELKLKGFVDKDNPRVEIDIKE